MSEDNEDKEDDEDDEDDGDDDFTIPLPAHVVAQLSNLQSLEIGDIGIRSTRMPPAAQDFARLFAAACPSLERLFLTRIDFDSFAEFVGLVWSFPADIT